MRIIGAILLSVCPIAVTFYYSQKLGKIKVTLTQTVALIEWLISEIRYQKRELKETIIDCSNKDSFSELKFLNYVVNNFDNLPFPKAWERGIEEWETPLNSDEKNLIKSLSQILGSTEAEGQINSLNHILNQIKDNEKTAKTVLTTKGKTARTLGALISIGILIVTI